MAPSRLSIISRAGSEYGSLSGAHLLSCIGADSVPIDEAGNGSRSAIKKIVFLRFEIGKLHRLKQTVLKILPFVCRDRRRMEDKPIPMTRAAGIFIYGTDVARLFGHSEEVREIWKLHCSLMGKIRKRSLG